VPGDEDCVAVHPALGVPCRLSGHPRERAHVATGVEPDGTRWTLFWWRPAEVHADPPRQADQPPGSDRLGFGTSRRVSR
jgi:hypothetical protein